MISDFELFHRIMPMSAYHMSSGRIIA